MPRLPDLPRSFRIDAPLDLHSRLHQSLCLVTAFFGIVAIPAVTALRQVPLVVGGICIACGGVGLVLFWAARRGHEYPAALFLDVLVAVNLAWFPNGGSSGGAAFYLLGAALIPVVFARGAVRIALAVLVLADYAALLAAEWMAPGLVAPHATTSDRLLDMASAFAVGFSATVATVWIVIAEYRADRQRLQVLVSALASGREQISHALQETARTRAQLSTLIDSTDDMVWVSAAHECRLTIYNKAFARYFAEKFGLAVRPGMSPGDLVPPSVAAYWRDVHARVLAEGPITAEYATEGGRLLLLSCNPIEVDGRRIGVSVFARDITERARANDERARLEQHLLQAQKMESLGSLAGGIAHDFNNMLAGIMGHADLLLTSELEPAKRESLRAIVQAATRSGELTKKLLAFARRGKNIVEPVDVRDVVRDCLAMLEPSLHPQVTTALALDSTRAVDGDPSQMHQMLLNLCINASEAMPAGGTLSIGLTDRELDADAAHRRELAPGSYVELRVADTGIGMSEEVARRAFEPFFTTKDASGQAGRGLGLSTVYGIVQLHKGAIALEVASSLGTTVTVLLPRSVRARVTAPQPAALRHGRGLILVVDDEDLLREFVTAALERLGYGVVTAADGEAGIDAFRQHHRDLDGVILDLKMPRKTGHDTFMTMHAIDPGVPVLICSGYGDNEEAQALISMGAAGLLAKPFKIAELSAQLAALGARPASGTEPRDIQP